MIDRRTLLAGSSSVVATLFSELACSQAKTGISRDLPSRGTLGEQCKRSVQISYSLDPFAGTPMVASPSKNAVNKPFWISWQSIKALPSDCGEWALQVDGRTPLSLTVEDLMREFTQVDIEILCRLEAKPFEFFKCSIQGVRFKDIISAAGIPTSLPAERPPLADGFEARMNYEDIFRLEDALDERAIVAYKMNGTSLRSPLDVPVQLFMPILEGLYEI